MNLHKLINKSQDYIIEAIVAEQEGDLYSAYKHIDKLYNFLTAKFVPMKAPICESPEVISYSWGDQDRPAGERNKA